MTIAALQARFVNAAAVVAVALAMSACADMNKSSRGTVSAKDEDAMLSAIRKGKKVDRSRVDKALRAKACDF